MLFLLMNHITQMNALEKQLKLYKDYVKICPNDNLLKLMKEILKILTRIEQIRTMYFHEKKKEVVFQYETKQSKSNFKTYL